MGKSLNNNSIKHTLPSIYPSPWCYTYSSTLSLEVFRLLASGRGSGYKESSVFLVFCWEEYDGGGRGFSLFFARRSMMLKLLISSFPF